MSEFEGQTFECNSSQVDENPLYSVHPRRTTEDHQEQEKGQNVKEHEVFGPCFLGSCTDGLPDNVLIVEGRRWPLMPDHCG